MFTIDRTYHTILSQEQLLINLRILFLLSETDLHVLLDIVGIILDRIPGGNYTLITRNLPENQVFRGNPVILNSAYLPSGAKKSWIDAEQSLQRGSLKEILFYTHNFTNGSLANIRLQIWRPLADEVVPSNADLRYRLVWQYLARNLDIRSARGILWRVSTPLFFPCLWRKLLLSPIRSVKKITTVKVCKY